MQKKNKIILICSVAAGVVLAGYGIGCVYFSSHFLPNTAVNEVQVSGKNVNAAVTALVNPESDSFVVNERDDQSESINLSDISYKIIIDDSSVEKVQSEQKSYTWIGSLFTDSNLQIVPKISYDKNQLETAVKNLNAFTSSDVKAPVDASIQKTGDTYEIVPEEQGNTLDETKTLQAIEVALDNGEYSVDLDASDCYVKPNITSDNLDLNNSLALLQKMGNESITIDMLNGDTEDLSGETLVDLLELGTDGNVTVNEDKLTAYVQGLADKYNTFNSKRTFTTSLGSTIQVGDGGNDTYGWLMDQDATQQAIEDAILSEQSQTVSSMWVQTAFTRNASNGDIGNTYIEVCISTQHLWYYQDGQLVMESAVVTGNPNIGLDTPPGVYRVWAKVPNTTLRGTDLDGSEYENPVKYWMPFDWGGRGLHDASWRGDESNFGGNIYERSSWSHGCINLPTNKATILFNSIALDTPLVVYS